MQHNYGTSSLLFDSILSPCAEEAERIICELFLPNSERPKVTIKAFTYPGRIERKKKTGYGCPKCHYSSIRLNANFCPGCGKPLKWVYYFGLDKKRKAGVGILPQKHLRLDIL
jgi:hypothetical protein